MTTFPPVPVTRTRLAVLAREKLPCSPGTVPSHRNSYKKSICVDMLRDGYHKSFTELFSLMEQWDALRHAAEVRSLFWLQRPLEEQPDKLDYFYHYLTRAEAAERQEYYEEVYNNLYALACYFDNSEDKWVRNHFYERCFNIARLIKADGGKKEAEAQAHMGLLFEEEGEGIDRNWRLLGFRQVEITSNIVLLRSVKNCAGILMGIALNIPFPMERYREEGLGPHCGDGTDFIDSLWEALPSLRSRWGTSKWRPHSNIQAAAVLRAGLKRMLASRWQWAGFQGLTKQAVVQGRVPAPLGNYRANEDQMQLPLSENGHMAAVRGDVQPTGTNVTSSHPEHLGQVKYNRDSRPFLAFRSPFHYTPDSESSYRLLLFSSPESHHHSISRECVKVKWASQHRS
ncbi:Ttc29 [Phodopus roborovskii]|uniref:Ttc29 protein n=1 Tax=Phodopus roborovskii TaxID=109678 RepID=A0AAV0A8J7_PHORO|nr:Ttc29 [Phodopus roborovskii]